MSILNPTVSVAPVDTASAGVTQDTANVNRTDQGTIPNQVDQPDTGVASVQRPRSNTPDADTKAGASMPPALINDPAVPSQKLAVQADLNKTSPAPHHSWVYSAAKALAGGPEYGVRYDTDGTPEKYEKRVSPTHIGMAIALEVLRGGLAGASEHGPGAEGRAGQKAMDQETKIREQRAKQVQDEMAQGTAAQQNKLNLFEANMKNYQTAGIVAQQSREIAQVYPDSLKALTEPILDGSMPLPEGSTMDKMFETDAAAGVKNKTISATGDLLLPYGDAQPVIDPATHQQKITNGQPEWGHMYLVVHNAANWRARLTKDMQDKLHEIGMFQQNGTDAKIGTPDWSMADLAAKYATYTQIKAGETLLQSHKDDAHKVLGRESENLDSLAEEVLKDPQMRKAMQLFVQAQTGVNKDANGGKIDHVPQIDEVLSRMSTIDPTATNKLMGYLKLDSKDLLDMQNARLREHTEAAKEKQPNVLNPEETALKKATTLAALSTVGRNAAETKKLNAEAGKLLNDESNESDLTDAIGTGHVVPDRLGYIIARKPEVLDKVLAKYPTFDTSKAMNYPHVYSEFTSTKKNTAGYAVNAGATAFKHLAELQQLNTNTSRIPGTKDYQAFQDKLDTLASELAAFYGNNTIPGIAGYKSTLGATFNRDAAITTQAKSMGDKMNSYEHQWYNAAPSEAYQAPIPWLDHHALQARVQLDPEFAKRVPEGAKFQGKDKVTGVTYWLNAARKPIQEVVQAGQGAQ